MPAERFFLPAPLNACEAVTLADTEFHHLVNVMRLKKNASIELVNGKGALAEGVIAEIEKKQATVLIRKTYTAPPPTCRLILAQALPRINRLDTIVEKCTELGMDALWLFPGDRSERKILTDHQVERLANICIAAMKQSGRLYLPEIIVKPPLYEWERPITPPYFGDTSPEAKPFKALWESTPSEITLIIGPESGLSPKETDTLTSWNAHSLKLHTNILRTDTAAIAAVTLASHWLLK